MRDEESRGKHGQDRGGDAGDRVPFRGEHHWRCDVPRSFRCIGQRGTFNMKFDMETHRICLAGILGLLCILVMAGTTMAADLPKEPGEEFLVNEDVNIITGLYIREYSLRGDDIVDFKTARQIIFSEYNEYWNTVVQTIEWPLFYWTDEDRDGVFEHFVDQKLEGQPHDIVRYLPVSEP